MSWAEILHVRLSGTTSRTAANADSRAVVCIVSFWIGLDWIIGLDWTGVEWIDWIVPVLCFGSSSYSLLLWQTAEKCVGAAYRFGLA